MGDNRMEDKMKRSRAWLKRSTALLGLLLVMSLLVFVSAGCAGNKAFSLSDGLDQNGLWKGIKALDYVDLCAFTGITVPSDVHAVTDEVVQSEIVTLLTDFSTKKQITDRAVADGDTVNIDYTGTVGGVAFDGGSTGGQGTEVTIGVTQYIDDFLQQLVGHSPGESFDVEVTFPPDYGVENLNGKDAVFATTVNYIVESTLPDLTDAFVAQNLAASHGWSTVAEMKDGIRSGLQSSAIADYVQEYVVTSTTVRSVPQRLITYEENSLVKYYQDYADSYQVALNEFLSTYVGVADTKELIAQNADQIRLNASRSLVLQAIAEDAGLSVTDDDVGTYFTEHMGTADYSEYETSYGLPYLKQMVLQQNVVEYLVQSAVLE